MKYIYKITYPNGKIYIGKDATGSFMTYFGSTHSGELFIERDFSWEQMQDFSIRKQILWSSEDATPQELSAKENELIAKCGANNPEKGYNLLPKFVK
jgi:hypothetical protein